MYKKAFYFDDGVIFYFDEYDRKYVAEGGSLAWRLNNPGLLTSHSVDKAPHRAIGSYHQLAIFPNYRTGKAALIEWLRSSKYFKASLHKIAEHYQPKDPVEYLSRLCGMTGLSAEIKLHAISTRDFDKLLDAIQKLAGFQQEERHFRMLPKITARCRVLDEDFYFVGYDFLLAKTEAIHWVEAHKLDAVIVHKRDGGVYLRSRPGHHFNRICLKQEEYGEDRDFKEAIRELGEEREGQCIWGFVNGVSNTAASALKSARAISKYAKGEKVWSLVNDQSWALNLDQVAAQKLGFSTEVTKFGTLFLRFLIEQSEKYANRPPVVVFAHSQGALIVDLALDGLQPSEREKICVYTFGGAAFISSQKAHPLSYNYLSIADVIPRISSSELTFLLLRIEEGKKTNLSAAEVMEHMVEEDVEKFLDTSNPDTRNTFAEHCRRHYEQLLRIGANISILSENISAKWEHSFSIPCYQGKVEEIVKSYRSNQ